MGRDDGYFKEHFCGARRTASPAGVRSHLLCHSIGILAMLFSL